MPRSGEDGWKLTSVEDDVKFEDRGVVLLTFENPREKSQFWIDVERGAVPLKRSYMTISQEKHATHLVSEDFNDDLREVGVNKGWLPFRHTSYLPDSSSVHQYVISEANFDAPPPSSTFRLEFPEPRVMVNGATMLRYAPRDVWDLRDLPSASAHEATKLVASEAKSSDVPKLAGERPPTPWWVFPVLISGLILVLGAGAMIFRRLHA